MSALDKLTEADIQNMFNDYKNGVQLKVLFEKYNIPHSTFNRLRNKLGIEPNKIYELHYNDAMQKEFDSVFYDSINCNYVINKESNESKLKYYINQHYFDEINSPNKAYILGLLYSDGYMSKSQYVCTLSLQENDRSILEKINSEMENQTRITFVPLHNKNENHNNQCAIHMYGRQIYESLLMHGCHPAKSLDLTFPTNLPMNLYKDFIRGMIDGDGYIKHKGSEIRIRLTSTPMFCNTAMLLIETLLKINCYIIKNNRSETNVDLCISGKRQVVTFLNWIYDNAELYIERKHDIYLSIINNTNKSLSI